MVGRLRTRMITLREDEYEALRVLAAKALNEQPKREPPPPIDIEDRAMTWQERNLVATLLHASGAVVPANRIVRHIHTTSKHAETDEWIERPASQVSRARSKLRAMYGRECIETVWYLKPNAKGRMIRDYSRGAEGYRWIGPSMHELMQDLLCEGA